MLRSLESELGGGGAKCMVPLTSSLWGMCFLPDPATCVANHTVCNGLTTVPHISNPSAEQV